MAAKLYLIRHGIAAEREEFAGSDAERPLIPKGRTKLTGLSKALRTLGLGFDQMLTSPLVRARQTAEILHSEKLCHTPPQGVDFLAPGGDFGQGLTWLQPWQPQSARIAFVGHEPDLSQWAELLLWGEARSVLQLKKAGIIGLELPSEGELVGHSRLFWLTTPGLMGL
jgi:phosphohistidine phosphatase